MDGQAVSNLIATGKQILALERMEFSEASWSTLRTSTLGSIVEWYKDVEHETMSLGNVLIETLSGSVLIHVMSPTYVEVVSRAVRDLHERKRRKFLEVKYIAGDSFRTGTFLDQESFVVNAMAKFRPRGDYDYLLRTVSGLQEEAVVEVNDSGVSQRATVKHGVRSLGSEEVRARIELAPYYTFDEIENPPLVPYLLRLKGGGNGKAPTAALFSVGSTEHERLAVSLIKGWILAALQQVENPPEIGYSIIG